MALALPSLPVGPTGRKILRVVGYVLVALVTFVFALQATFPYDRVKERVIDALSSKYDVTIGGVERGIMPGTVAFTSVSLRTRPTKPDEVASMMYVQRLEISLGLLALLGQTASVDIEAQIGPGTIEGNIQLSRKETVIDLVGTGLPSGSLPIRDAIGLPMSGKIGFTAALTLPIEKMRGGKIGSNWEKATGTFTLDCPSNCTIGDGEAKLKPKLKSARNQAFAGDGIVVKLGVDSLSAKVGIKKGLLQLDKFDVKSKDIEAHVDFNLTLQASMDDSLVGGCLRFKASDSLMSREPSTHSALTTTGATLGPDGLFHIRLDGTLKDMKRLAQNCGPSVQAVPTDGPRERQTPTVTVQPADDSLKGNHPTGNQSNNQNGNDEGKTPPNPPPGPVNEHETTGSGSGSAGSAGSAGSGTPHSPPNAQGAPTPASPTLSPDMPVPQPDGTANAGSEQVEPPPHDPQ